MKNAQKSELNEVIITGWIVSQVRHHHQKCLFTLQNGSGRFCVQWQAPSLRLKPGLRVMVQGELYSVLEGHRHSARVRASSVTILEAQEEPL